MSQTNNVENQNKKKHLKLIKFMEQLNYNQLTKISSV